jgi:hypothetical protein
LGEGIFKTTNANATDPTWNKLTQGLPSNNLTRIVLDISQSSPTILYALMADDNYQINMFYQSSDAGNTWNQIQPPIDLGKNGFYNINVAIHPQNENIVYLSGISLWRAIRNTSTNNWEFSDIDKEFHPRIFFIDKVHYLFRNFAGRVISMTFTVYSLCRDISKITGTRIH